MLTRRSEDPVISVLSAGDGSFVVGEDKGAAVIVAVVAEGGVKDLIAEKDDAAGGNLTVYCIGQIHLARQETQAASPVVARRARFMIEDALLMGGGH